MDERERLAVLKAEGLGLRAIASAARPGERRRSAASCGATRCLKGGYLSMHAEGCYLERRQRPPSSSATPRLGQFVRSAARSWTPEQIAGPATWLSLGYFQNFFQLVI
jgi:hypothetical protein